MKDWFNSRMVELKKQRLDDERRLRVTQAVPILTSVLENFALDLPPNALIPQVGDVLLYPVVQNIIHANETNDDLTEADFEPVHALFPELMAQTLREREEKLMTMIAAELGEEEFDPATILQLATTTFRCRVCGEAEGLLSYPRVLVHQHAYNMGDIEAPFQGSLDGHPDDVLLRRLGLFSWGTNENISFRKEDVQILSDVLIKLGMTPKSPPARKWTRKTPSSAAPPVVKRHRNLEAYIGHFL